MGEAYLCWSGGGHLSCSIYMANPCAVLFVIEHVLRSTEQQRKMWLPSVLAFLAAAIFGPFCWFCHKCFPDAELNNILRRRVEDSFWVGLLSM